MKITQELRSLSVGDLKDRLEETKKEIFKLDNKMHQGGNLRTYPLKKGETLTYGNLKNIKKRLATIKTIIHEKEE